MTGFLTRDQFLKPSPRRYKEVELPDGSTARIRNLTEDEKSTFEASVLSAKGEFSIDRVKQQRRRLICLCLVNAAGDRILSDEDATALKQVDGALTSALYDECRVWCGFDEGDIEELVKNSTATPDAPSCSDSAASSES